jgi:hypothetical protein
VNRLDRLIALDAWRGLTVPQIANCHRLSQRWVYERLRVYGVRALRQSRHRPPAARLVRRAAVLRSEGLSYRQIGGRLGIATETARLYVLRARAAGQADGNRERDMPASPAPPRPRDDRRQ